jgi:hypothetical protein
MVRLVAIALFLTAAEPTHPTLAIRVFPPISIAPLGTGCSSVLFTAEIRGPEAEGWYCPRVEWRWPDGTVSTTESDCPAFAERGREGWHREGETVVDDPAGFPRRWARSVCLPAHPQGKAWVIEVRLSKAGRTIATAVGEAHVR